MTMESIKDFVMAALPWVMLGLSVALLASNYFGKKGKKHGKSTAWFTASTLMYLASALTWLGSDGSSGAVTWFCLGSAYLCFGATEYNKEKQADNKDDEKKDEAEQKEN